MCAKDLTLQVTKQICYTSGNSQSFLGAAELGYSESGSEVMLEELHQDFLVSRK